MGADLYIEPQASAARTALRPAFDAAVSARDAAERGSPEASARQTVVEDIYDTMFTDDWYFRDSYNGSNVLNRCGLSWWRDVIPMLEEPDADDDGSGPARPNLLPFLCLELADQIEAAELKLPDRAAIEAMHLEVDDDADVADWHRHWTERRVALVAFLRRAAEHDGLYASL